MKSQQLYSIEDVKLSSDGTYADITIAGDASVAGTSFLMSGVKYGCTVNYDGDVAYLEFELPDFYSDLTVTAVDLDEGKITVVGSGRSSEQDRWEYVGEYEIGDLYEGNLGALLGCHVNMNVNSDGQVTDFNVQDETVTIGAMKWTADSTASDPINKWYFKDQLTDKKYYWSSTENSSNNITQVVEAIDGSTEGLAANATYAYAKLVLNPNGTVASAVLADTLNQTIICTVNDEGKITQDSDRAVDLSSYTVEKDGDYIDAEDIEEGDIIFYNTATKFADVFTYSVTGEIGTVYSTKVDLDDTTYELADAQRFDADNLKYVAVTEKWLLSLDDEEDTTLYLNRQKKVKFVDGTETGKTVTTDTDYVVVKATTAYADKGITYLNLSVSDGEDYSTIPVKVSGLKKLEGVDVAISLDDESEGKDAHFVDIDGDGTYDETIAGLDEDSTGAAGNGDQVSDLAALFVAKDLITITTKDSDGSVTAIAHKTQEGTLDETSGGSQKESLEPADTTIKSTGGNTYSLLSGTKVWILDAGTSGRTADAKLVNFSDYTNATATAQKATVEIYPSTSNKTAVDSILIDNTAGTTITGGSVKTTVNAIVVGYETGLNVDDEDTYELKKLTVWVPTSDGGKKVTYTASDFANQIKKINNQTLDADTSNDTNTFDTITTLAFDNNGLLLFVSADADGDGVADDAAVATVDDTLTASSSATQFTLSDGTSTVKLADEALILVKNKAKDYAVTTISDVNLNENYLAGGKKIYWHKSLGTNTDQVADVLYVVYSKVQAAITPSTYNTTTNALSVKVGSSGTLAPDAPATCDDGSTVTYSLASGTNTAFTINEETGVISWASAPTAGDYTLNVQQSVSEAADGYEAAVTRVTQVVITTYVPVATYIGATATTAQANKTGTSTANLATTGTTGDMIACTGAAAALYVLDQKGNVVTSRESTDLTATGTNTTAGDYAWATDANGKLILTGAGDNADANDDVVTILGCAITITAAAGT